MYYVIDVVDSYHEERRRGYDEQYLTFASFSSVSSYLMLANQTVG